MDIGITRQWQQRRMQYMPLLMIWKTIQQIVYLWQVCSHQYGQNQSLSCKWIPEWLNDKLHNVSTINMLLELSKLLETRKSSMLSSDNATSYFALTTITHRNFQIHEFFIEFPKLEEPKAQILSLLWTKTVSANNSKSRSLYVEPPTFLLT